MEVVWRQCRAGTQEGAVKGSCQGWLSRVVAAVACTGKRSDTLSHTQEWGVVKPEWEQSSGGVKV